MIKFSEMPAKQFLKISLFYNKNRWPILLDDCLLPLFSKMKKNDFISSYLILLSAADENCLRVILYTNEFKIEQAKYYFKHFTQTWMKNNRSANAVYDEFSIDRVLWMSFKNNSFHYNAFLLPTEFPTQVLEEIKVCEWLSNKINDFIKANLDFDVEDTLTFAFSLGLSIADRMSYTYIIKELHQLIDYKMAEVELVGTEAFSIQSIVEDFKRNSQAVELLYENSINQQKNIPCYFSRSEIAYSNAVGQLNFENRQSYHYVDALKLIVLCCGFGPNIQLYFYVFLRQILVSIIDSPQ
jgi:hypothetical protein